jgi:spore coat polysaccharide biosynthesis protein SpsF (cytidylyltransferase family)
MSAPRSAVAVLDLASISVASGEPMSALCFRRFGRHALLEWSLRRLSEAALLDHVAIVGPKELEGEVLRCSLQGAVWVPCDSNCGVERSKLVAEKLVAKWLIYTSPKCPFVDEILLDRMIGSGWKYPDADYVGYFSPSNPEFSLTSLGLVGEMCHRRALERLAADTYDPKDVRTVAARIRGGADVFNCRLLPLPTALDNKELRFSLESAADWEHVDALLELSDDDADYRRLAEYSLEIARMDRGSDDGSQAVGNPHWNAKLSAKAR